MFAAVLFFVGALRGALASRWWTTSGPGAAKKTKSKAVSTRVDPIEEFRRIPESIAGGGHRSSTATEEVPLTLNDLTGDAIKRRLVKHGVAASGSKPELIAKLIQKEPHWRVA